MTTSVLMATDGKAFQIIPLALRKCTEDSLGQEFVFYFNKSMPFT